VRQSRVGWHVQNTTTVNCVPEGLAVSLAINPHSIIKCQEVRIREYSFEILHNIKRLLMCLKQKFLYYFDMIFSVSAVSHYRNLELFAAHHTYKQCMNIFLIADFLRRFDAYWYLIYREIGFQLTKILLKWSDLIIQPGFISMSEYNFEILHTIKMLSRCFLIELDVVLLCIIS
jgi:hypothetical protein